MKIESNVKCQENQSNKICLCPIEGIIDVISKKWALLIVGIIGNHQKIRYKDIMKNLNKINPKTLSDRLKELENAGLIKREAFAEIPPRVEYSLTKDGFEVRDAMIPLMEWASKKNK
ncbi:MAG TPA: helix-turn-helix domain-containing protein [Candidatus Lokiarchaeia archaeon]